MKREEKRTRLRCFRGPAFLYHSLEPLVGMNVSRALGGVRFSPCSEGDAAEGREGRGSSSAAWHCHCFPGALALQTLRALQQDPGILALMRPRGVAVPGWSSFLPVQAFQSPAASLPLFPHSQNSFSATYLPSSPSVG